MIDIGLPMSRIVATFQQVADYGARGYAPGRNET